MDAKLYMPNNTVVIPTGIVENVPVQVGKFFVPTDFLIIDCAEDPTSPIILGRPFLATADARISVKNRPLTFTIGDEVLDFSFGPAKEEVSWLEVKSISIDKTKQTAEEEAKTVLEVDKLSSTSTSSLLELDKPLSISTTITEPETCQEPKYGVPVLDLDQQYSTSSRPKPKDFCFGSEQVSAGMNSTPPQSISKIFNDLKGAKTPWRENLQKLKATKKKKKGKGDDASNHLSAELAYYHQDLDDPGEGPSMSRPHNNGP